MRHVQKFAWVVLVAAIGCGGDDSGDDEGSGGSAAGTGGSAAGTGGTGGSAAGTGGGMADPACVMGVIDRSGETGQMECAECVCEANETATNACDEPCWDLVLCVRDNCDGDARTPEGMTCVSEMCADELTAGQASIVMAGFQPVVEGCLDAGKCM